MRYARLFVPYRGYWDISVEVAIMAISTTASYWAVERR